MNLDIFATSLLTGISLGMVYVMMAVGLSIILGMMDIPNFAHGVMYQLGAYTTFAVLAVIPSFTVALLLVPVVVAVVGLLTEYFGLRRLYASGLYPQLLFLFAFSLVLRETIIIIWGSAGMSLMPPAILQGTIDLGVTEYPVYRLFIIVFAALIVWAVWLFLSKTKYGAIVRAGIENKEMVSALGINVQRLFTFIFALGAGLAGLGGALISPLRGTNTDMGIDILPIAFVVVVIGGLGNFQGAIVAGLLVGITQNLIVWFWPAASLVSIFFLMALVLLIRPQGLFGMEGRK